MKIRLQFLISIMILLLSCNQQPPADYLLKNGLIFDGLGNPSIEGNLLIRHGKMELVKSGSKVKALNTIDATGLIITPGFVDVHNHTDQSINNRERRLNEGFIRQGVTTIVGGPDGRWAPAAIRNFIAAYDSIGIGTNVAFYVGHNGIRSEVMQGDQQRRPNSEELSRMKELVREGMDLGAVGLSTGLMYPPGMYSETEEVILLAKEVAPYQGIYDSHVRNPVHEFVQSHKEVVEIATRAGIPGKLGHLKAVGLHNDGKIADIIELVESARAAGHNIISDQYPYDGAQTANLESIIIVPSAMQEHNTLDDLWQNEKWNEARTLLKSLLANRAKRAQIKSTSEEGENGGFAWLKATGYSSMRVTNSHTHPHLVGKFLSQIAEERNQDPFDTVCELIIQSEDRIFVTLGGINEKDVQTLLVKNWNMIASDGAYADGSNSSRGHPRGAGTFTRFLGHYVRDLKLLPLEEAIRKITSLPADVVGLTNRGRIMDGLPADLVIFDPVTIIDNSTFEQPNLYSSGVIHVFVNGIPVLLDEKMTGQAPGKYLKKMNGGE